MEIPMAIRTSSTVDPAVRDTTVRLRTEFGGQVAASRVAAVVAGARNDLDAVPATALPELLERLARQRLLDPMGEVGTADTHDR